jgi:hypothetical protein
MVVLSAHVDTTTPAQHTFQCHLLQTSYGFIRNYMLTCMSREWQVSAFYVDLYTDILSRSISVSRNGRRSRNSNENNDNGNNKNVQKSDHVELNSKGH